MELRWDDWRCTDENPRKDQPFRASGYWGYRLALYCPPRAQPPGQLALIVLRDSQRRVAATLFHRTNNNQLLLDDGHGGEHLLGGGLLSDSDRQEAVLSYEDGDLRISVQRFGYGEITVNATVGHPDKSDDLISSIQLGMLYGSPNSYHRHPLDYQFLNQEIELHDANGTEPPVEPPGEITPGDIERCKRLQDQIMEETADIEAAAQRIADYAERTKEILSGDG